MQYLKELYILRENDFAVKVESGTGGSPSSIVQKAIRLRGSREYDKCYVLIDADKPLETDSKLADRMKKRPCVEVLKATPCIEGLFLAILKHSNFSQESTSSDYCKKEFELTYMASDRKTDKRSYVGKFSKTLLDERRTKVPELDLILKAMQT